MGWRAGWWDLAWCSSAVNCQTASVFFCICSVLNLKTKTCWASGCFLVDSLGGLSSCCQSVLLLYCTSRSPVQICALLPKSKLKDEHSVSISSLNQTHLNQCNPWLWVLFMYVYKTKQKQNGLLYLNVCIFTGCTMQNWRGELHGSKDSFSQLQGKGSFSWLVLNLAALGMKSAP